VILQVTRRNSIVFIQSLVGMEMVGKTKAKNTFYITTAIDYPNAEPHIGHAYQKVIADILARWHKLNNYDVFFLTGTDEHGKKIQEYAQKAGQKPKKFVDNMSKKFKEAWSALDIEPNRFIRTTDKDHQKIVQEAIKKCNKNGDIYKGYYEGLYCTGCEAYYTEKDLEDGLCPIHKKPVEKLKEESYFFKLSKYEKYLLDLYKKQPSFVMPDTRRHEMTNRVKEGLKDISISRTSFDWGIPFPLDKKHVTYVWFDALFNYVSGAGKKQKYWPADIHLLGKDNGWFHAVYWPAFLKSAGYELPKTVFIHGFLTVNGEKISKSLGNVISPKYLAEKYGADTIRYFVARNFVLGEDGDFSESTLVERHNGELANKLGNLVSRVSALAEQHGMEQTKTTTLSAEETYNKVAQSMSKLQPDKALNEIFALIDRANEYAQEKKPWETKDKLVIYNLVCAIKDIAILLSPFMPKTSEQIAKVFKFKLHMKELHKPLKVSKIKKAPLLFKKIELANVSGAQVKPVAVSNSANQKPNKPTQIEGVMELTQIKYDDFAKLDLRVATIKKAEDIEGADKLYKLQVDLGTEQRQILAGIKQFYTKEALIGKQVIVIANLEPRKMKGLESQGMLLAAGNKEENTCILISPEKKAKDGTKIS
jgi:methionyl-tRNA synthetase